MACWPVERMLACHVVDLQFSLLLWLAKLAGAWRAGIVHTVKLEEEMDYDAELWPLHCLTLGKHTYEILQNMAMKGIL